MLASWELWSTWGSCTKTCGTGTQLAFRDCSNGTPGDKGCHRDEHNNLRSKNQPCNINICRKSTF